VGSQSAERCLPLDEPSTEGHFPGNPIIPGAALLREVLHVVSPGSTICCAIRSVKFLHPVRPGDRLVIVSDGVVGSILQAGQHRRPILAAARDEATFTTRVGLASRGTFARPA